MRRYMFDFFGFSIMKSVTNLRLELAHVGVVGVRTFHVYIRTCNEKFGEYSLVDCDRSSAVSVLGHERCHTSHFLLFIVINLVSRNA